VKAFLLVGLLSLMLVTAAAGGSRPSVWIVQATPATVAGSGFAARSKVLVAYASAGKRTTLPVLTNRSGAFRAVLPGTSFSRCSGAVVTAGKAALRVLPCTSPGGRPRLDGDVEGTVSGNAFVPREAVTIVARVSGGSDSVSVVATASPSGAFTVSLPVKAPRCAEVFFSARGALGSTAKFTTPAPACRQP
jgi:hypothetical protein